MRSQPRRVSPAEPASTVGRAPPQGVDAPGFTATEMHEHVTEKLRERIVSQIPVGRFGRPDEIARVVHFFASDYSSFITGAVWDVNGGREM